ncbi:MAG TPA: RidA family protein [Planctomycetota bacterium]|nr:RidA family protein [Planctomycetota bacterium]
MGTRTEQARIVQRVDETFGRAEREEMRALGLLDAAGNILEVPRSPAQVERTPITSHDVLNEAYAYALPSSFSRGVKVTLQPGQRILWLSGTASIDDQGVTVLAGDFRAQLWRTYRNLTQLLKSEGATWHDVVRTTCYLRDIERDYDDVNRVRTLFFRCLQVDPLPASTGIQARLCRSDLLIEIELFAVLSAP